jgi:virginiamycin B lyase
MRNRLILSTLPALAAVSLLPEASPAQPADGPKAPVSIQEWTVPWDKTRPRDPYVDDKSRVWFVGQSGNYIAYLEPTSGRFTRFEIDSGTYPHNLIVGQDGMVWYAGNRNAMIGKLDPATGAITRYPMPAAVRDPHTLIFDKAGDIWFTAQQSNHVGRLATRTGKVDVMEVKSPGARPYGIVIDSKNRPWFNEFGTSKVAMIDPATMSIREYDLPNERARGRRIAITSDDAVWYVDYTRGMLARLDPASGAVEEWPTPGGPSSLPYGMAVDDRDRIWFVESGMRPNRLVGFDTRSKQFVSVTPFGVSPNGVRHIVFHAPTRELWFGTDANTLVRARLP